MSDYDVITSFVAVVDYGDGRVQFRIGYERGTQSFFYLTHLEAKALIDALTSIVGPTITP